MNRLLTLTALVALLATPSIAQTTPAPQATPPLAPGFYVAPSGNDANAGTLGSPFATLARANKAMENSTVKTTYVLAGTYHLTTTLTLTTAGVKWQNYPPDGVDSAVLDGGGTVDLIAINDASNVTIDGLKLQRFKAYGIIGTNVPGLTVENCDVGFNIVTSWSSGGIQTNGTSPNQTIKNNYVHDVGSHGIAIFDNWGGRGGAGSIDGTVIDGNVVLRAVQRISDGGSIYLSMHGGSQSQNPRVTVQNNFVGDYGASGITGASGIYLDDNASFVTVAHNIVGPASFAGTGNLGAAAIEIHNGHDNHITGNIIDLGNSGHAFAAVWYQGGASMAGMARNTFTGNIVVSAYQAAPATNFTGIRGALAFFQNAAAANYTIQGNSYFNYAGGTVNTSGPVTSDTSPILTDPHCSGHLYFLAPSSPALAAGFVDVTAARSAGPRGFVLTHSTNTSCPDGAVRP